MSKYRIIKRRVGFSEYYYAQCKIFNIWVDLQYHPFVNTYDAHDLFFDTVEEWLKNYIESKKPSVDEVIKEYE